MDDRIFLVAVYNCYVMADDPGRPNFDTDGELCESLTGAIAPLRSIAPDADIDDLDVAGLPADSIVAEWSDSEPLRYLIVGGYGDSPVNLVESDFRRQFDGLVFIRETTAARPVASET